MARKSTHYLTGAELKDQIWRSKLRYCYTIDTVPEPVINCQFSYSGETLPDDMSGFVRHFTLDHVPPDDTPRAGKRKNAGYAWTNFRPFKIYQDGQEIVRSHWTGGFNNGHFSITHASMTNRLGEMIIKLVNSYGTKSNWSGYSYNDEMRSAATVALCRGILLFDDSLPNANVFAYASQIAGNAFIRVQNTEKASQNLRDQLLTEAGVSASYSYQNQSLGKPHAE